MTFFPSSDYAHCPHCGESSGMGLVSEYGRCFVQCFCGARGPGVERSNFQKNGPASLDIKAMDHATRSAWNSRAGSNGLPELHVALTDAVGRMIAYKNSAIMVEVERWAALIAAAQDCSQQLSA